MCTEGGTAQAMAHRDIADPMLTFERYEQIMGLLHHASRISRFPLAKVYHAIKCWKRRSSAHAHGKLAAPTPEHPLIWRSSLPSMDFWCRHIVASKPGPITQPADEFSPRWILFSDASSQTGWGVTLIDRSSGEVYEHGRKWCSAFQSKEINFLEAEGLCLAVQFAQKQFPEFSESPCLLLVDNTAVKSTVRKGYAAEEQLNSYIDRLQYLLRDSAETRIAYVPTNLNPADAPSRGKTSSHRHFNPLFHSPVPPSNLFFFGWKNARTVPVFAPLNPISSTGMSSQ